LCQSSPVEQSLSLLSRCSLCPEPVKCVQKACRQGGRGGGESAGKTPVRAGYASNFRQHTSGTVVYNVQVQKKTKSWRKELINKGHKEEERKFRREKRV
jgi:hypothetical protein